MPAVRTLLAGLAGALLLVGGVLLFATGTHGPDDFGWFVYAPGENGRVLVLSTASLVAGVALTGLGLAALGGVVGHGLAGGGPAGRTPVVAAVGVVLLVIGIPTLLSGDGDLSGLSGSFVMVTGARFGSGLLVGAAGVLLLAGAVGHRVGSRAHPAAW